MKIRFFFVFFFAFVRGQRTENENSPTPKAHVAIVGAGIAGLSTAFWLKTYLNDSVAITIYESDEIGGRLRTVQIDENQFEAGGTIIHEKNLYMKMFAEKLGLEQIEAPDSTPYIMTDDGSQILFSTFPSSIPNSLLTLYRYGYDAIRLKLWTHQKLSNFLKIYDYQENGGTFESVEQFLKLFDEEFYASSQQSFRKYLLSLGFKKRFIEEIGQVASLVNYDQSIDRINGFPGLVSLMATGSTLWRVRGGNKKVVEKLVEFVRNTTNVEFVKGKVKSVEEVHRISEDDESGDVRLSYQPRNSQLVHSVSYDFIVVGFPLHKENFDEFHVSSKDFDQNQFEMQTTFANFLESNLNCSKLPLVEDHCQELKSIFYTSSSLPYRSVAEQRSVENLENETKRKIYKVFSPNKLSNFDYEKIFGKNPFEVKEEIRWFAYPKYKIPQEFPPIDLMKNVFYLNAMEWSASCMEIETIAARNVALLLAKKLGIQIRKIDKHEEF